MAIHPTSVQNSHVRHFIFWVLFLPLLAVVFVPALLPEQQISDAEVAMVQKFGVDTQRLQEKANATFSSVAVSTGAMIVSENFFAPKTSGDVKQNAFGAKWIRGVWLMVYKLIWRSYALVWIFFIPALALCIPAAIDGIAVRARKKYQFEMANPVFFYSSAHLFTLVLGLFFFLPVAPLSLSANVLVCMLLIMALAVWMTASNFQTGS
jgi:hypothetical protein